MNTQYSTTIPTIFLLHGINVSCYNTALVLASLYITSCYFAAKNSTRYCWGLSWASHWIHLHTFFPILVPSQYTTTHYNAKLASTDIIHTKVMCLEFLLFQTSHMHSTRMEGDNGPDTTCDEPIMYCHILSILLAPSPWWQRAHHLYL